MGRSSTGGGGGETDICQSQWWRGLRRRSAAARLLGLWGRIPPGGHGSLSLASVVLLSGRGTSDEPIARPKESYRCRV